MFMLLDMIMFDMVYAIACKKVKFETYFSLLLDINNQTIVFHLKKDYL